MLVVYPVFQPVVSHLFQIYPYNQTQRKDFFFSPTLENYGVLLLLPLVENVLFSYIIQAVGIDVC